VKDAPFKSSGKKRESSLYQLTSLPENIPSLNNNNNNNNEGKKKLKKKEVIEKSKQKNYLALSIFSSAQYNENLTPPSYLSKLFLP
jgi:hypothetical protein